MMYQNIIFLCIKYYNEIIRENNNTNFIAWGQSLIHAYENKSLNTKWRQQSSQEVVSSPDVHTLPGERTSGDFCQLPWQTPPILRHITHNDRTISIH